MAATEWAETERSYDVPPAGVLPDLVGCGGVAGVGDPVESRLEATYFDTEDLVLARHGVTLRRRTGGDDAGWHVKLPGDGDTRLELRHPLGRSGRTVPQHVLPAVRALVRDHPLLPVARIANQRVERALLGEDGAVLASVADDRVTAERLHGSLELQEWREWEVELVDGDAGLLDAVEERLLGIGAERSALGSKLLRALGSAAPSRVPAPSAKALRQGSAGDLVTALLRRLRTELHRQDARVRTHADGGVHRMRIAARRLRSALKTYGPLLDSAVSDPVADELRWLGQALAPARDAQVLREHLGRVVAEEAGELVLGPVVRRLDDELRAATQAGRAEADAALSSERYFRLLDALDALVDDPPLTERADRPARKELPRLLARDAKRLRRAVAAADDDQGDDGLHEARKKAKRLRYAAESAEPVLGKQARRLAKRVKKVQQALGEHQDTVVARAELRAYGVRAHLAGENGFTFGRLHALEQVRADEAERRFREAWSRLRLPRA